MALTQEEKVTKLSSPWVSSSFDDLLDGSPTSKISHKSSLKKWLSHGKSFMKHFPEKGHTRGDTDSMPWTEMFAPKTKNDLAVHKKKVEQVECWLKESITYCSGIKRKDGVPLLLLTGSAGTGKTATTRALAAEMGLEVCEWISSPYFKHDNAHYEMDFETSGSQTSVFRSFLLRANKYPSLLGDATQRKLILIEDFPNVFLRDANSFHEILRKYKRTGRCPAVFIVTDNVTGESFEHNLFPKTLQAELDMCNISFNPIAPTMMLKALTKISGGIDAEMKHKMIDKTHLERIAASSKGDIRSAINILQFASSSRKNKLHGKHPAKKRKRTPDFSIKENELVDCRDTSLFLFHALGKVLYCKRDASKINGTSPKLPLHLQHLERIPLLEDPEEIFRQTAVSADCFNLFLHQNYLSFIDDTDVAVQCSSWMSQADLISSDWRVRESFNDYAASLSVRGLMFNLTPYSSKSKYSWKSMHKPQWYAAKKSYDSLAIAVKIAFRDQRLNSTELQTELLPILSKLKVPLQSEQRRLVEQVGVLGNQKFTFSKQPESLSEKDVFEDVEEINLPVSCMATVSINSNAVTNHLLDEEIIIEDYDD